MNEASNSRQTSQSQTSQPLSAMGEKIDALAEAIRDTALPEGPIGTAATAVAERLDAVGSYLHKADVERMVDDVSSVIRRYPIPSLLIGVGIGYLLARATRR